MSNLSADLQRAIAIVVAGLAILIALWIAVIGPKRSDSSAAAEQADTQQARLDTARTQVTAYTKAKQEFGDHKAELRRLDKAVPARGDIADLLRELQDESDRRDSDLRIVALAGNGAAAPAPGTDASAVPTPGAQPGPAGLSALPFELEFTGRYYDLVHVLRTVRRAVDVDEGKVKAKGRLMSIDALAFERPERSSDLTTATITATAYIAPARPSVAAAPAAGAPTTAGSTATVVSTP